MSMSAFIFAVIAPTGLVIRFPSIRPRSGKPVSAATFDPKEGRVSKVDYFNGPGANASSGLKKISAERSITFLPQMPLPQKREVRQLPPPPPYPRPMAQSSSPLRAQIATFALDVHGEGVKIAAENEKLSVWQEAWRLSPSVAATAGVGGAAFTFAFIFAHEGMSYKLTSNDIAQIAGFSATVFAAVFAYFKGRID
jgi:hypothetical protein